MSFLLHPTRRLFVSLLAASLVGVGLFAVGAVRNQSFDFWYLSYNLVLALIPLLLAVTLQKLLKEQEWKRWLPLVVTFLWVLFLPNSFYIVSDFIHLQETPRADVVQDVVMLMQFSFMGLVFGFMSLFMVHREFIKRVSAKWAAPLVGALLFLSSFAIYLGRDLRWNSWDIIVQPFAIIADIFDHIFHPIAHPEMGSITLSFFFMLASMYAVIWYTAAYRKRP
ncbi:MAG TPA: DUF1361 domain-containing protein [Candidatus Saccharimonadales bacterium]|nr:DUF1361 domain-containing protein [Candidatus Saccharimonadales bacterium]